MNSCGHMQIQKCEDGADGVRVQLDSPIISADQLHDNTLWPYCPAQFNSTLLYLEMRIGGEKRRGPYIIRLVPLSRNLNYRRQIWVLAFHRDFAEHK